MKRLIVNYESLNDAASILNEHYMICKKGDLPNETVSGVKSYDRYLYCLIEYLNALVIFVCQIEKTLHSKPEEEENIYATEISEKEFDSIGIVKKDLDKIIFSIERCYPKLIYMTDINKYNN